MELLRSTYEGALDAFLYYKVKAYERSLHIYGSTIYERIDELSAHWQTDTRLARDHDGTGTLEMCALEVTPSSIYLCFQRSSVGYSREMLASA